MNILIKFRLSSLRHRWPYMILAVLFRSLLPAPKRLKLFGFPMFSHWVYLMKVIPETPRAHLMCYICVFIMLPVNVNHFITIWTAYLERAVYVNSHTFQNIITTAILCFKRVPYLLFHYQMVFDFNIKMLIFFITTIWYFY